mmetsp:Transcript_98885/g.200674  ORF Transcript_98885/g.200674 Transcript_98885/m.200674 type:complete len:587 (-) Transcript_98885:49-1809(-)|eukprot:CAMPEP_0201192614 /NCGR_PEP_ID=MMETSP0851-20130426/145012_1 /ASSEMBLY_ACC=CAM_ASM_000631 /TAXON_ID=183588 /ORGANISM="Pseudo-nitzschia fraudulenta, Strain WWA7" /LENGTH=586 /DNA_ID=CAMNT_0047478959 /DNA_START=157 /DNA_END=1917 /DNA_ORIENTATION=+
MASIPEVAPQETNLSCDYLVVGAGTACLSFVDVVLSSRKDATFIIVDRFAAAGGHWNKAYSFVRLHQQSCNYGVNGLPLGKLDKHGKELYDLTDRKTGKEVLEYYEKVIELFKATGRVRTFFETNYEGEATNDNAISSNDYQNPTAKITHTVTTKDGRRIRIDCTKIVRTETNVIVPSMRHGVPFPIDESVVRTMNMNELPDNIGSRSHKKYVVIGAGKSGVDALIYLMDDGKVHPDQITWVVSRPVWYLMRDGISPDPKPGTRFWKQVVKVFIEPLCHGNSAVDVFTLMEKSGVVQRVDPDDGHFPQIFKSPVIDYSELKKLRSLKNIVSNKGRITSITSTEMIFEDGSHSVPVSPTDTIFVDCTTDQFGYNFDEDHVFFNPHKIRLGPLTNFVNPSHSSAQAGYLEAQFNDDEAGDAAKNSFLFYPRGTLGAPNLQFYLMLWYCEMKTNLQFDKEPPYLEFVLGARTDLVQPEHHGGIWGLLGVLWAIVGPTKLKRKTMKFVLKFEAGGFEDFPVNPLAGRTEVDPVKVDAVRRILRKTKSMPKKNSKSGETKQEYAFIPLKRTAGPRMLHCCRGIDAVENNAP